MDRPVRVRDVVRLQQPVRRPFLDQVGEALAHERCVDRPVDDDVGDVDSLLAEFTRGRLRERAQAELAGRERGVALGAAQVRRSRR
jgi:hypothetical protein